MDLSSLSFLYDEHGFGELVLCRGFVVKDRLICRTGSRDESGALVNALPYGEYSLQDKSEDTTEIGMWIINPKSGWKIRLYKIMEDGGAQFTHYLIHPDGGLPGTRGCIGIQGCNAGSFRVELDTIIQEKGNILLTVGTAGKAAIA